MINVTDDEFSNHQFYSKQIRLFRAVPVCWRLLRKVARSSENYRELRNCRASFFLYNYYSLSNWCDQLAQIKSKSIRDLFGKAVFTHSYRALWNNNFITK